MLCFNLEPHPTMMSWCPGVLQHDKKWNQYRSAKKRSWCSDKLSFFKLDSFIFACIWKTEILINIGHHYIMILILTLLPCPYFLWMYLMLYYAIISQEFVPDANLDFPPRILLSLLHYLFNSSVRSLQLFWLYQPVLNEVLQKQHKLKKKKKP